MSARMARTGPGRDPVSRATTLVGVGRVISRFPKDARVSATNCAVRSSWKESSGCWCRWRRQAITVSRTDSSVERSVGLEEAVVMRCS